ncbi:MAG: thiamine pyrophosphate-dependent dehydrogenase E1 component subunit alpha [Thermoplasmata archaeon]
MVHVTVATLAKAAGVEGTAELSASARLEAYRWMVTARVTDERCLSLQRQGRIGFYAPLSGQEAAQVGATLALRPEDWVFPAYRELAVALVRGVPLSEIFDQLVGNSRDRIKGRQMPNHFGFRAQNFVVASSPIGTQITHAVGAAMAAQRRHDPIATLTFFGDGATSSNDFHAGLNFAGVFRTPTIFFCQNNQWAISLPRERQTRSATLAEKAEAYGFPGVVIDGNDLDAVYRAVSVARRRAIGGEGPTLIEALVYRLGPHSTSDDPHRYRSDAEVAEARQRDPLHRLKTELLASGHLDDAGDQKLWESIRAEVVHAIEGSEQVPPVDPHTLFEDVFAAPTPRLEEERSAYDSLGQNGGSKP